MSSLDQRLTSWALSLFHALETNTRTRTRVLAVAGGVLAVIGMWLVHLSYPFIVHNVIEAEKKILFLFVFGLVIAPPFAVAFIIGSLIWPQANEPDEKESGPMSGYFYQERGDSRWKIVIVAAIISAMNFVAMLVTSSPS